MADVGLIRKRLRQAVDRARQDAVARRERADQAQRNYERFLEQAALPAFRAFANVLRAEGLPFDVQAPSGAVRLQSDRNRDDVIELELDPTVDPPQPVVSITRARGSRIVRNERPVKAGATLAELTEDDVVDMLLDEIRPWLA
ncbi:MAG: hypothetical protein AB7O67_17580 [Vicinamibacterales bacterium]